MNLKIEVKNLKNLHSAFRTAPGVVKRNMRLALRVVLRNIQRRARQKHNFQSRSGNLERSISTEVVSQWPPKGRVFLDPAVTMTASGVAYGAFQHNGTADHEVLPRNRKALRWVSPGGGFAFSKGHQVSGIHADPFIYKAAEVERKTVNVVFSRYTDKALKEAGL